MAAPRFTTRCRVVPIAAALIALASASCAREAAGPTPAAAPPPELLRSAIRLTLDLENGTATVAGPSASASRPGEAGPSFALFGANEIEASITNVTRSAVGAFQPWRARVTFDLSLTNRLANADLVPGTFPAPPVSEVVAFPFATEPSGLLGLSVLASPDWDGTGAPGSGAPHNFFNDDFCIVFTPPGDCYRWESFGASLAPGETVTRRVGFDVLFSVTDVVLYVAVAADVRERPIPAGTGVVAGVVSSPERGPLADLGVTVSNGAGAVTDANGHYTVNGLPPGTYDVALAAVPDDCAPVEPRSAVVVEGRATVVSFEVSCQAPTTGRITGTVTNSSTGAPLAGVGIAVSGVADELVTDAEGRYVVESLGVGTYTVSVPGPVEHCVTDGAVQVVPVTPGFTAIADFALTCVDPDVAEGSVIITEFGEKPMAAGEKWVELYNTTDRTIDLTGWSMAYGHERCVLGSTNEDFSIEAGGIRMVRGRLPMTEYFALANSLFCVVNPGGIIMDPVELFGPDGRTIDIVGTDASFPDWVPGQTFSLDPSAYDHLANDAGTSWCVSQETHQFGFGTPGVVNPPCPSNVRLARLAADGTTITVTGTVTGSFPSHRVGGMLTYIQDATGGIALFPTAGLPIGQRVQVEGTRVTVSGEPELADLTVVDLGPGEPVVPTVIQGPAILDEANQGMLVEIRNVTTSSTHTFGDPFYDAEVVHPEGVASFEVDMSLVPSEARGDTLHGALVGVLARGPTGAICLLVREVR